MWIKKYTSAEHHGWKTLFEHALNASDLNPQIILSCNFDMEQWDTKPSLSNFYKDILTDWFKGSNASLLDKKELIWYNKNILINNKPVFYPKFKEAGITFISDLYDRNRILPFTYWQTKGFKNVDYIHWRGLLSSIIRNRKKGTIHWEENITARQMQPYSESLLYNGKPLNVITSKLVYTDTLTRKYGDGTHTPKINRYLGMDNANWSTFYVNAQKIPIDSQTREFQFRFLHDILLNNFWLRKWNIIPTDECTFCKTASETILHLFWQCNIVQGFWRDFKNKYMEKTNIKLDIETIIGGSSNTLACTLIFLAKKYIYDCRYLDKKPDIRIFDCKVNFVKNIELEIAKRNGRMLQYLEKWELLEDI